MRTVFSDRRYDSELHRSGYVDIPILTDEQIVALREAVTSLEPADGFDPQGDSPANPTSYHCTFLDTDLDYRRALDTASRQALTGIVDDLLDDYEILVTNCYVKPPGRGAIEVHQNWTLTPDVADTTLTMWVPLQDTDEANATLQVVPGSHKLTADVAYPLGDHYFTDYQDTIATNHFESVPVKAGHAVFFDDSLIHGSGDNQTTAPRFSLQVILVPAEATTVIWFRRPDGNFDLLDGRPGFYLNTIQADIDSWPEKFERIGGMHYTNQRIPESEFLDRLERGAEVRHELWGFPLTPDSGEGLPRGIR